MIQEKVGKIWILYKGIKHLADYMYDSSNKVYYKLESGQIIRDTKDVEEIKPIRGAI
jgi:hypothetical protein